MAGFLMSNPNALPGVGAELVAAIRELLMREPVEQDFFPIGTAIDGTLSTDPDNPTGRIDVLRDGIPLGRVTATNKYAVSLLGVLGRALTGTATQLNMLTAAEAAEIVRRIGATGTFKLTGPSTAAGAVRTRTVTYSAVGAGSGVNEVQLVAWTSVPTAGTFTLTLRKSDGTLVTTAAIAYNATCSTTVANAINAILGTSAVSVAATASTTADNGFSITFSGTNYAAIDQPLATVDASGLTFTSTSGVTVSETTKGCPVAATITITALGTAGVYTITSSASAANGTFIINVGGQRTSALAYNVSAADMQTALRLLSNAGSDVTVGLVGQVYTITFNSNLGDVALSVESDSSAAATSYAPLPVVVAKTATGVDGRFVAGSLVQPTDGSENIVTLLRTGTKTGVSVYNALLQRIDVQNPQLLSGGVVRTSYILGYSGNDASTKAWIKAQLRANGGKWLFDDDYLGIAV
jgi:hypothetical protein